MLHDALPFDLNSRMVDRPTAHSRIQQWLIENQISVTNSTTQIVGLQEHHLQAGNESVVATDLIMRSLTHAIATPECCNCSVLSRLEPILASYLKDMEDLQPCEEIRTGGIVFSMHQEPAQAAPCELNSLRPCHKRTGTPEAALNAARLLGDLVSTQKTILLEIAGIPGFVEELVELLKGNRSSLDHSNGVLDVLCAASTVKEYAERCIRSGGVALAVSLLSAESRRPVIEKSLGLLQCLLSSSEGRAALAKEDIGVVIATIAKKVLRVSEAATESAVEILWIVCRYSSEHLAAKKKAAEAGLMGKLVVVLQVDGREITRRRAGRLMRLLAESKLVDS